MTPSLRIRFFAIVLLAAVALYIVLPIPHKPDFLSGFRIHPGIDLAGGAELRYKVLFGPEFAGDRTRAVQEASDVVRRRIDPQNVKEHKVAPSGDGGLLVQLAGIDADELRDVKRRVATIGNLRLYAAAPPDVQELFARNGVVPADCKVFERFLVEKEPVIEGRHVVHAEPMRGADGRWVTSFELDGEGAKRFDDAAERLYHQVPRGRIVIVLDDKVRSAPVVKSPAFHGRGQITGVRD